MGELNRVLGLCFGTVSRWTRLVGRTIVHAEYNGCMATKRVEVRKGRVLRRETRLPYGAIKPEPGVIVRYPSGDEWEPLARIWIANGILEVR